MSFFAPEKSDLESELTAAVTSLQLLVDTANLFVWSSEPNITVDIQISSEKDKQSRIPAINAKAANEKIFLLARAASQFRHPNLVDQLFKLSKRIDQGLAVYFQQSILFADLKKLEQLLEQILGSTLSDETSLKKEIKEGNISKLVQQLLSVLDYDNSSTVAQELFIALSQKILKVDRDEALEQFIAQMQPHTKNEQLDTNWYQWADSKTSAQSTDINMRSVNETAATPQLDKQPIIDVPSQQTLKVRGAMSPLSSGLRTIFPDPNDLVILKRKAGRPVQPARLEKPRSLLFPLEHDFLKQVLWETRKKKREQFLEEQITHYSEAGKWFASELMTIHQLNDAFPTNEEYYFRVKSYLVTIGRNILSAATEAKDEEVLNQLKTAVSDSDRPKTGISNWIKSELLKHKKPIGQEELNFLTSEIRYILRVALINPPNSFTSLRVTSEFLFGTSAEKATKTENREAPHGQTKREIEAQKLHELQGKILKADTIPELNQLMISHHFGFSVDDGNSLTLSFQHSADTLESHYQRESLLAYFGRMEKLTAQTLH